jgi:hypothetical protein
VLKEGVVNEEEIGVSSASPRWIVSYRVGRWGYVAAINYQWIKVSHPSAPPRFKAWRAKATLMGCIY